MVPLSYGESATTLNAHRLTVLVGSAQCNTQMLHSVGYELDSAMLQMIAPANYKKHQLQVRQLLRQKKSRIDVFRPNFTLRPDSSKRPHSPHRIGSGFALRPTTSTSKVN